MLQITGLVFNSSICLRMSAAIHLLPMYAFMAQSGTALHIMILLVLVIYWVMNYWFNI